MKKIFLILLFLLPFGLLSLQKEEPALYKHGKPTSRGIDYYIKTNKENFVKEYQTFIKDTLYNYYVSADNFNTFPDNDSLELGRFYIPDEIIINNEEKYCDYEIKFVSKFKKRILTEYDMFVKGVVMHELTHDYFYQIILEMRMDTTMHVNTAYNNFRMFPSRESGFASEFIEEGICNYVAVKMQEKVQYTIYDLTNINDITNKENMFNIKYRYSEEYVKDFLDLTTKQYGRVKEGIKILLANKPPTYEEMLNPNLFFNRLH